MRTLLTRVGWAPLTIIAVVITIALLTLVLPRRTSISPATDAANPTAVLDSSVAPTTSGPTAGSVAQAASPPPSSPIPAPTSAGSSAGGSADSGPASTASTGGAQPTVASASAQVQAEPTPPAAATQQVAVQTATYIDMARKAAPAAPRPGSNWDVQVIPTEDGPAVMLIMPLSQPPSNTSALTAAKQRITDVVNMVFVNDSKVVRLGVVGTYQNSAGKEVPAISLIVRKSASPRWGSITPSELERLAQNFYISAEFQK